MEHGLVTDIASDVSAPRLLEAADLLHAIDAAEKKLPEEKRAAQLGQPDARTEVIPEKIS